MNRFLPPGLLRADVQPDTLAMICTAGHVDHGKTSLVKMLTGCATDRLKTEQERGLTIELGFAPCFLGDDLCAGIVDVPGHERFVRTMVSGVSGIDLTILTIAADDGIMPQTVEHLQILELLDVRAGIVALTKTDLASPARIVERSAEITAFLRGTFLENSPILPVSAETGAGYEEFYNQLVKSIRALRRRPADGVFRMPVERVFNQPGFGEVITGIPVAGRIRLGDTVTLSPGEQTGKIRGIQCFLRPAKEGGAGQCLALNVPEWGKNPPRRGQVITLPGYLPAASLFYVRLHGLPHLDPPLRHNEEIRFHTGTAETNGRLFLLHDAALPADASGAAAATIRTDCPVAAGTGDRFILRRASPPATVAGGIIRFADAGFQKPRRSLMRARTENWESFFNNVDLDSQTGFRRRFEYAVRESGTRGITVAGAARDAMLTPQTANAACASLCETGCIRLLKEDHCLHQDAFRFIRDGIARQLDQARDAGALYVLANEIILKISPDMSPAVRAAVLQHVEDLGMMRRHGESILLYPDLPDMPHAVRMLAERMLRLYEECGYHTPRPAELPEKLESAPGETARILDYLVCARRLVRINENVILTAERYIAAQNIVVDIIRRNGTLDSPTFRDRLQTSRKYAMSLLDFMDARRVTVRQGNARKLLPGYEQRLWS